MILFKVNLRHKNWIKGNVASIADTHSLGTIVRIKNRYHEARFRNLRRIFKERRIGRDIGTPFLHSRKTYVEYVRRSMHIVLDYVG